MDAISKMLGSGGYQIAGAASGTPIAVEAGNKAYGAVIRVDDTMIISVTQINGDDGVSEVVTDKSWQNVALFKGEYIPFEDKITSITLHAAADSVGLVLEKL